MNTPARPYHSPARQRGVALIIVLLTLFTLGVMAGIFAYAMKVETKLAVNTSNGTEMEWLGRSGIELAKWILIEQDKVASERGFYALNQFWAGGPGPVDSADNPFAGMSLRDIPIGQGRISLHIVDQERWVNINYAARNQPLLDLALSMAGADTTDASVTAASIRDWVNRSKTSQSPNGAKDEYYLALDPPYLAKNGPIDHINELLLIRGVTPAIFWGSQWRTTDFGQPENNLTRNRLGTESDESKAAGLVEMFCAVSQGQQVNINTAPEPVLRLLLGGDAQLAREMVRIRAGADGVDGTEDDEPDGLAGAQRLRSLVPPGLQSRFNVRSSTFSVRVTTELGSTRQVFQGLIRRAARSYELLVFRRE